MDLFAVDQLEQAVAVGMKWGPVVEHQGRFACEGGNEPVPHHPATRREVEHAVAGAKVRVQPVFLQVLEQRTARAVDDALGLAGRAR